MPQSKREGFVAWFHTLTIEQRAEVWYECEAQTAAEFGSIARDVLTLDAWSLKAKAASPTTNVGPDGKWGTYLEGHRSPKPRRWVKPRWFLGNTASEARAAAAKWIRAEGYCK